MLHKISKDYLIGSINFVTISFSLSLKWKKYQFVDKWLKEFFNSSLYFMC